MEEINNPPLPFYGHPAQIQDILYYDVPLPPWTVEISSVGEVWFFFGTTQEYSPFYMTKFSLTKFSLTNFICQMCFDRVNQDFSTKFLIYKLKIPNLHDQKTFDI